jgi:hypothetical protein
MDWLKTIIDFILKLLRTPETPRSRAKGKIYIRYEKTKRTMLNGAPYSEGLLSVIDKDGSVIWERAARSGGWGKGDLPDGEYKAAWFNWTQAKGMVQFGVGWLLSLLPQFKTDRTQVCIHLDQPPEGSEGCIVFDAKNKADAKACGGLFEALLDKLGSIDVEVC